MKNIKKYLSIFLTCTLLAGSVPAFAEAAADEQASVPSHLMSEQLSLEDINGMNGGEARIYTHGGFVTFIDGTCSRTPILSEDDASCVVDSMMELIGADPRTEFILWRRLDFNSYTYYIFQQMYGDMTVCGGAVKLITDADGNMVGLTSSVESELPDKQTLNGISAEEAEQTVRDHEKEVNNTDISVLAEHTGRTILPTELKFDIESEDYSSRFVWVVYSDNPSGSSRGAAELPYLAHYVSMSGEYLYSMPAIIPGDEAGESGYDGSYIFEFMEPAEYTGYVDLSDGSEKELTVTVMRDRRTGMYYLGNIERRIIVADCYEFLYNNGNIVLEYSPDNLEWDQTGLLSLYNYCRAWDYYNAIGWKGGDGKGTPMIILNNFCDDRHREVNNAAYVGKVYGFQCFVASKINDLAQCLDVIAHEFTHCVTGSVMTFNSYINDYGAINEGMSDIQGKICDMMTGEIDASNWVLGSNSMTPVRDMKEPHNFNQPDYTWDLYYQDKVSVPTAINDYGGVHINSSLLNNICYRLTAEGGMTLEEARTFWFMVDCTMVPKTDYVQLSELLPWVLTIAGMDKYSEALSKAIEDKQLTLTTMPENFGDDRSLVTMELPDTEAFDTGNWALALTTLNMDSMRDTISTIISDFQKGDFSDLPISVREIISKSEEQPETEDISFGTILGDVAELAASIFADEDEDEYDYENMFGEEDEEVIGIEENKAMKDLMEWFVKKARNFIFSSNASAGQDGKTVKMVVRPGRTIPYLMHATVKEGS
ncbi:MAG: M4 family metallopeptidase, partial [Lachnospiraceae bacterium]|nr:M4 family metallopeptidase [Lachnospiraceae bacterium]